MNHMICICISGDKKMNAMFHIMDVFENFKAFATVKQVTFALPDITEQTKALSVIREATITSGQNVVACFYPNIKEGAYRNKDIKVISDGRKFALLEDVLTEYGYTEA